MHPWGVDPGGKSTPRTRAARAPQQPDNTAAPSQHPPPPPPLPPVVVASALLSPQALVMETVQHQQCLTQRNRGTPHGQTGTVGTNFNSFLFMKQSLGGWGRGGGGTRPWWLALLALLGGEGGRKVWVQNFACSSPMVFCCHFPLQLLRAKGREDGCASRPPCTKTETQKGTVWLCLQWWEGRQRRGPQDEWTIWLAALELKYDASPGAKAAPERGNQNHVGFQPHRWQKSHDEPTANGRYKQEHKPKLRRTDGKKKSHRAWRDTRHKRCPDAVAMDQKSE